MRRRPSHIQRVAALPGGPPKRSYRDPDNLAHLRGPGLIVLMGSCGSGKSTFARTVWPTGAIVDVTAHALQHGNLGDITTSGFADAYRETELRLARRGTVVFDSTGVTQRVRASCRAIAAKYRAPAHLLVLDTPTDIAARRNSERDKTVPDDALAEIRRAYQIALGHIEREAWDTLTILSYDAEATLIARGRDALAPSAAPEQQRTVSR